MRFEENRSFEYASVYILDNPYCIDATYDYFIPLSLRGEIGRGSFVAVPFGRSNRRQMALVAELTHAPSYKDAKPVDSLISDRAPLSEEMMQLSLFMKEHTLCTVGEAVRCAVPAAAVVAEGEVAFALACAYLEKFGSDTMTDIRANLAAYKQRLKTVAR